MINVNRGTGRTYRMLWNVIQCAMDNKSQMTKNIIVFAYSTNYARQLLDQTLRLIECIHFDLRDLTASKDKIEFHAGCFKGNKIIFRNAIIDENEERYYLGSIPNKNIFHDHYIQF